MDLSLMLAGVVVLAVALYVILDGFDLGVGILFPFLPSEDCRDTAVASIAPVWDGNETWLILAGAVLFGAFPLAYSVALPAFYIPLMLLMFSLIFRGVAFEFRHKAKRSKTFWDRAFIGGSTLAAFAQGLVLGGVLEGVTVVDDRFAGGAFDWATPFSFFCGFGVVAGYALLGATWLNMKTQGITRDFALKATRWSLLYSLVALVLVSLYTPLYFPQIAERWFADGHWLSLSPVPIATAVVAVSLYRETRARSHIAPFIYTIALFALGYIGIGISLWPNILPPSVTIADAAAPEISQKFVLVALVFALPMVLIYTGYAYWVFRGKVEVNSGYETH